MRGAVVAAPSFDSYGARAQYVSAHQGALHMLRTAVGVLVAAAVGIHCSAAGDPTSTSQPTRASAAAARGAAARADPRPTSPPPRPTRPGLTALVHDGATRSHLVRDGRHGRDLRDGHLRRARHIGDTVITSRGEKDVFLLKLDPGARSHGCARSAARRWRARPRRPRRKERDDRGNDEGRDGLRLGSPADVGVGHLRSVHVRRRRRRDGIGRRLPDREPLMMYSGAP